MSDIDAELNAALTRLEADYLEDLGKHEEAAKLRQTFAALSIPDASELLRAFLDDSYQAIDLRAVFASPPEADSAVRPDAVAEPTRDQVIDARIDGLNRLDRERVTLEQRILELRQFEREYRRALGDHLQLAEESAPDEATRERILIFRAWLESHPNSTAETL